MEAKIWNKSWWLDGDVKELETFFKLLRYSGFNVLDVLEHKFKPQGYTALYLLSESHFAVHTFPEANEGKGRIYIELSSCMENYYNNFCKMMNGVKNMSQVIEVVKMEEERRKVIAEVGIVLQSKISLHLLK